MKLPNWRGAINTVVNMRDENGQVIGKLKGYTILMVWDTGRELTEEAIDFKGNENGSDRNRRSCNCNRCTWSLDGISRDGNLQH